jgi:hypothetical protein
VKVFFLQILNNFLSFVSFVLIFSVIYKQMQDAMKLVVELDGEMISPINLLPPLAEAAGRGVQQHVAQAVHRRDDVYDAARDFEREGQRQSRRAAAVACRRNGMLRHNLLQAAEAQFLRVEDAGLDGRDFGKNLHGKSERV